VTAANDPQPASASGAELDDTGARAVVRRAPFSDNPTVGARGQRTQQRILDAALRVFGEEGYHQTSIDRITKHAGCSRVSFYQYFSGKEDVFRDLAGQVSRQVSASTEALDPLTADPAGRAALRAWVARYGDIYERYEPVFRSFAAAAESDEAVAGGSVRVAERYIAGIRARLAPTTLPPRQVDPVINLLVECVTDTCYQAGILRPAAPAAYPRDRIEDAVTDVMHRSLFGVLPAVNVRPAARPRPPDLRFGPGAEQLFARAAAAPAASDDAGDTVTALVEAGREVFVQRGFHGTRVDDIVAAAGLSHGAFYRYFDNKATFGHIIAARAMQRMSVTLAELQDATDAGPAGRAALRRWLRRYNAAHAEEAAMVRVWVDATTQDPTLGADSAPILDWGRRRLARFLARRGFGDVDADAVVMIGLLAAYGARRRPPAATEAAAHVIEQGLLGRGAMPAES
jgi:AcrR family transcriptional regulator